MYNLCWEPPRVTTFSGTSLRPLLTITPTASATIQVGQSYAQTNVASGGTPSYVYSLASGALPAGTTLNTSTGTVSGTPTTSGAFSYAIKVTDSGTPTAQTATTTTVSGRIATPGGGCVHTDFVSATAFGSGTIREGLAASFVITGGFCLPSGNVANITSCTISAGSLPGGGELYGILSMGWYGFNQRFLLVYRYRIRRLWGYGNNHV